jgi:hypothetical protein
VHFHAAGQAAAGKGELNYANYWPALMPMVAKFLTEQWGPTLVLSPVSSSTA